MGIQLSIQGLLIYASMAAYLSGFIVWLAGDQKPGRIAYAVGFAFAAAAWLYRWADAGHVPLDNMYDVLLFTGMLMFPLSVFCRRLLGVDGACWDMLIGAVVLAGPGFAIDPTTKPLMPALQSSLFVPHVAAYMIAYVIMAKAGVQAILVLPKGDGQESGCPAYEVGAYRLVCLGFPLLTAGLILGAWWGKLAWGDWWNWDPKELWSLAGWVVYLTYFHVRRMYGRRYARANAALVLTGLAIIIITLLWANLSRIFAGLHSYA